MKENKLSLIKNKISLLVIHCSDTPDDKHLTGIDIHNMHLSFGWDGVGYHKIIQRDGTVENGRPEYWIGAHVYEHNQESLGICLIGKNQFTKKQFNSLEVPTGTVDRITTGFSSKLIYNFISKIKVLMIPKKHEPSFFIGVGTQIKIISLRLQISSKVNP